MLKVMFVCYGNICRSPTAEFVFKALIKEKKLDDKIYVSSSATSSEELGNPVYPPSKEEMKRHGIDCSGKCAVKLRSSDYEQYDMFIGMDDMNIRAMIRILNGDPDSKVRKLMDFTPEGGEVSDPWYTRRFDKAYEDISRGCRGLLEYIKENNLLEI